MEQERKIDLNSASEAELEAVVGEEMATAIVEYRTSRTHFRQIDDLWNVPGVDGAAIQALRLLSWCGPVPGDEGKLDLNQASRGELIRIPRLGPRRAEAIIKYRRRHGGIHSIEELREVPGIGSETLAILRERVRV